MKITTPAMVLGACALLAACSPAPTKTEEKAAPVAVAKACDAYKVGENGVTLTNCTGKATAKINVGGKDYTLAGGVCDKLGASKSVNIGVQSTDQTLAPLPDNMNLTVFDPRPGPFYNATLNFVLAGKRYSVRPNQGQFDAKGGTFEGESRFGHQKVTGSFTC